MSPTLVSGPTHVKFDIATFTPSQLQHALLERGKSGLRFHIVYWTWEQCSDAAHTLTLLRLDSER